MIPHLGAMTVGGGGGPKSKRGDLRCFECLQVNKQ